MRRHLGWMLVLSVACSPRPGLDAIGEADLPRLGQGLSKGFLWGTATAGAQIEGGLDNDWKDWEQGSHPDGRPHIKNRDTSAVAADSWNRFDADLAAIEASQSTVYRFSVEWSRLEPSPGVFDDVALNEYKRRAQALRSKGVAPMVTLHHFALPRWVAAKGGFENADVIDDFERYVRHVAPVLGPEVDLWVTLNEPNVYAVFGYLVGDWPPGVKDRTDRQTVVIANMLKAHGRAAAALRELDTVDADLDGNATRISVGHHVRAFLSASQSQLDQFITGITDDYFNEAIPRALTSGRIRLDVPGTITLDEVVPGLAGSIDFLGIQYYTRYVIRGDLGSAALSTQTFRAGRPTNDLGWETYPDGLYEFLNRFKSYGLPIFVTENGMPDAEGSKRSAYLAQHVAAIERAQADGAQVIGYCYWSLMDNFEWAEGFDGKFGLFSIDYRAGDLTRRPTPAVEAFKTIGANIPR